MKHSKGTCIITMLLVGLSSATVEAKPQPAPLDQEEYLDAEDWFQSGLLLNSRGDYREAAEAFSRSVAIDPENPLAWLNLGTAQALYGDYGAGIESLKKALALDPKLAMAYANLGEIYFKTEHFQEALETYGALLRLWPDDSNAHYKRGLAFVFLSDAGQAQAEYLSLKILDPDLAGKLLQAINQGAEHR
jgi:tetratricopeptide (TPR) repeat protein